MEDISIFTDKSVIPDEKALVMALGNTANLWSQLKDYVYERYPKATEEWKYPGAKYGWSFRIKDKKRVLTYLLPRDQYFKVALVFNEKATREVLDSTVNDAIKKDLRAARAYAEGRGIRIDVRDETVLNDIRQLIDIKVSN